MRQFPFVLIAKTAAGQHRPDFLGGQALHLFQDGVGHFRAPIVEAVEGVVGGVLQHLVVGESEDLRVGR
jgi:hypothetical protein